jgi:hypothetical protein
MMHGLAEGEENAVSTYGDDDRDQGEYVSVPKVV